LEVTVGRFPQNCSSPFRPKADLQAELVEFEFLQYFDGISSLDYQISVMDTFSREELNPYYAPIFGIAGGALSIALSDSLEKRSGSISKKSRSHLEIKSRWEKHQRMEIFPTFEGVAPPLMFIPVLPEPSLDF
uniref:Uncharacterized protein n=1 Tax=Romanomermis culicivorax TaxID=13658 RepID=A0A915JV28_ROMCU